ncbi:cupin domain-containing protein [Rhodocytophaga rosea]|uniref:Cupin domain-containing protein n=1 Tax=Rhodocytophaga rosea TaxID=2704465 RepID=A0A6C0GRY9_9BACT|nr:cupin domain-containing protein [Rhodocytophaga rosea]QHT70838.1 cupin domain-containing protein [Rhodocytophaga rosea]
MTTNTLQRRFYNPVQKDYVTFLETCKETKGKRTHGLLEVYSGGKVNPHYHLSFSETFIVRSGTLHLQMDKQKLVLQAGEKATVPPNTLHAWSNTSKETLMCDVILEPGNQGFEKALQAGYGLATDGLIHPNGMPKSIWHLALLVELSETKIAGGIHLMNGLLGLLARIAKWMGRDKDLEKYYKLD